MVVPPSPTDTSSSTSPLTFSSHTLLFDDDDDQDNYDLPDPQDGLSQPFYLRTLSMPPPSDPVSRSASRSTSRSASRSASTKRDHDHNRAPPTPAIPPSVDRSLVSPVVQSPSTAQRAQPYFNGTHSATASTSTLKPPGSPLVRAPAGPRQPSTSSASSRRSAVSDASTNASHSDVSSVRRLAALNASSSSLPAKELPAKQSKATLSSASGETVPRMRTIPHLPHNRDAEPAPASVMYWSRAPVWGTLPTHGMRAHSVTLVDHTAWVFGGCDDVDCFKDVWCFHTETMQWTRPEMQGEIPPPCRAHTATLVDRKLVVFGGGQSSTYYSDIWVLDTQMRRWTRPSFDVEIAPAPRRAHTTVMYKGKLWIFGGGNGEFALNDLWTLDITANLERLKWQQIEAGRVKPKPRGYHTATLVGNMMIVIGGSDGHDCFYDIWCLNLDTCRWKELKTDTQHRRLSHSVTQVGSYLFVVGGHDSHDYTSELLLFNLVTLQYEPRRTLGRPFQPRGYHVSLLADSRLFIFGGHDGRTVFDDVHILDLAAAAYLPQVTSFQIET